MVRVLVKNTLRLGVGSRAETPHPPYPPPNIGAGGIPNIGAGGIKNIEAGAAGSTEMQVCSPEKKSITSLKK